MENTELRKVQEYGKYRNDMCFKKISFALLSLYCILAFVDVIEVLVPYVLISYGVMVVVSLVFLVFFILREKVNMKLNVPSVCFIVFCAFTLLSMIINKGSMDRNAVAIFNLIQIVTVVACIYELRDHVGLIFLSFCRFVAVFSLVVFFIHVSMFDGMQEKGITPQHNTLGSLLAMSILCLIYIMLNDDKLYIRIFSVVEIIILFYLLVKTTSRTSMLSLICAIILLICLYVILKSKHKNRVILLFILLAGCVFIGLFVLPSLLKRREGSPTLLTGREIIWINSLKALKGHYLLGFGGNTDLMVDSISVYGNWFSSHYSAMHLLHNIYIQVLVEYGIIVFISFVFLVVYIVIKSFVSLFKSHVNLEIKIFCIVFFAYLFIHDMAESSILYIGGPEQFSFIMTLGYLYLASNKEF